MALWSKNESVASMRRTDMIIYMDGGITPAPRNTNFTGKVFIDGLSSPHFSAATGTLTNKRLPLTVATDTIESVNTTSESAQLTAHSYEMLDGPFQIQNSGGAVPGGLAVLTNYWLYVVDANNVKFCTSVDNAIAGVFVDLTSAGSGTNTIVSVASTSRGIDGLFTYEAPQVETDVDVTQLAIIVEGSGYQRKNGGGAYTLVDISATSSAFEAIAEGGTTTYGELLLLMFAVLCGTVTDYTTGTYAFRDPTTGTKIRITFTTDASGRLTVTFGDLTP